MKSKLAIPMIALVAMIAVAVPSAMAESGMQDQNHKRHHVIEVTGFVGSIQITEDSDKHALKEQITVSLSDAAAAFPDAKRAGIGVAVNENGEKFVVWKVVTMDYDHDTKTGTKTINVIDAGDLTNTTTVTKEIDHTQKLAKITEKLDRKIAKITEKVSQSSGDSEKDALRADFLSLMQQLRDSISTGDVDSAKDIRDQLKDIRSQLNDYRRA